VPRRGAEAMRTLPESRASSRASSSLLSPSWKKNLATRTTDARPRQPGTTCVDPGQMPGETVTMAHHGCFALLCAYAAAAQSQSWYINIIFLRHVTFHRALGIYSSIDSQPFSMPSPSPSPSSLSPSSVSESVSDSSRPTRRSLTSPLM
jgi:hypothetical protein